MTRTSSAGKSRAVVVTFSGIDGAGKSTLIERLRARLQQEGRRVLLLSFWDDVAVLQRFREFASCNLLGGDSGVGTPDKPVQRRDKNVQSRFMTAARLVMYLLDAARLRTVVAGARAAGAEVIFFDRYLYDEVANLPLRRSFACAYARLLLRVAPKPELACLVDADPLVAQRRKPEYPLEFLRHSRNSYLKVRELTRHMTLIPPAGAEEGTAVLQLLLEKLRALTGTSPMEPPARPAGGS